MGVILVWGKGRIFGIETELGYGLWNEEEKTFVRDDIRSVNFMRFWLGENTSGYLGNGARTYVDAGGHPEYATPECDSVYSVVLYEKAMETFFAEQLRRYHENMAKSDLQEGERFMLIKHNTDGLPDHDNTFGCHENYMVPLSLKNIFVHRSDHPFTVLFKLFLVTRVIFCGSGTFEADGFKLSQRARFIKREDGGGTTMDRTLIVDRDEPHACADPSCGNTEKPARLHLIDDWIKIKVHHKESNRSVSLKNSDPFKYDWSDVKTCVDKLLNVSW